MIRQGVFGPCGISSITDRTGVKGVDLGIYDLHLIVYIEGDRPRPIIHMAGDVDKRRYFEGYPDFMDLVEAFWPLSFDDALLLTTLFPLDRRYATPEGISRLNRYHRDSFFEGFLSGSRGLLLYCHQLEQVCSMVQGMSPEDAIAIRRTWNQRSPSSAKLANIITISEDYTLLDLLNESSLERMGCVYDANFKGAYPLYEHVNRKH